MKWITTACSAVHRDLMYCLCVMNVCCYDRTSQSDRPMSGVVITCEHASNRLPAGFEWPIGDQRLVSDHWAYDPGSEQITRELRSTLNAVAVLSRFSRLLIDPNRPLTSDTLIRTVADGKTIQLNRSVSAAEQQSRIERFYKPYHTALQRVVQRTDIPYRLILSLHSYTSNYEGQKRAVEIGVLHSAANDRLAESVQRHFASAGYDARLNEPWSGRDGYMYAADSIAAPHNQRPALMIEFRNDLLIQSKWRAAVITHLIDALKAQNIPLSVDSSS